MIRLPMLEDSKLRSKVFAYFRGCDFTTDPAEVDDSRSPDSLNMINDDAGFPEKRVGWRVMNSLDGRIYGLFYAHFAGMTNPVIIVHHGTKLSAYDFATDTKTQILASGMAEHDSQAFMHGGYLYIMDGSKFRRVTYSSGWSSTLVANDAKVPTTGVGGHYEYDEDTQTYTWVACTPYEEPNLLTNHQLNTLAGDGTNKDFWLTEHGVTVTTVEIYGGSPAAWTVTTAYTVTEDQTLGKTKITFTSAPAAHPDGAGIDDIRVEFTSTENPEQKDLINNCCICAPYGYFNDNRIFVSGNPDHKNRDWASGVDDPTYWEKNQWTDVGSDHTAIQGYLHYGDILAIVKEDDNQDAEIYIRSASVQSDNSVLFPVQQGVKGVGAVSRGAFATLRDDALFYAREGVFAVSGTDASQQRTVQNRSYFVDNRLRNEPAKDGAVAAVWNNRYLLAFPDTGHCYVADSKMQAGMNESYVYEWMYWDNIHACKFVEFDGNLFFGTTEGKLCKMNSDLTSMLAYNDNLQRKTPTARHYEGNDELSFYATSTDEVTSLKETITPTQSYNGYSKPWAGGAGKNKLPAKAAGTYTKNGLTIVVDDDGTVTVNGTASAATWFGINYIPSSSINVGDIITGCPSGGSVTTYELQLDVDGNFGGRDMGSGALVSTTGTVNTIYVVIRNGYHAEDVVFKPMVRAADAPEGYEPYENECPVSGMTGTQVFVSPTDRDTDATMYSADWSLTAGTVYAGTYDFVSGKLKARPQYASYNGETLVGPWLSSLDLYAAGTTPTTGAQVIDLGGTETEYTLTGATISLLNDMNYILAPSTARTLDMYVLPDASKDEREAWEGGEAIDAHWTTKADVLGTMAHMKTLTKRGNSAQVKPYSKSSVSVFVITNNTGSRLMQTVYLDACNFADIDFENFDFNALSTPVVVPFNSKVKKFQFVQIRLENDEKEQCFGLFGIQLQYIVNNYIK